MRVNHERIAETGDVRWGSTRFSFSAGCLWRSSWNATGRSSPVTRRHAVRFNTFCTKYLNPFLNFHRPCLFATEVADPKKPGRIKRVYRPQGRDDAAGQARQPARRAQYLRQGIALAELYKLAHALTDVQAAEKLNEARTALFRRVPARAG